MTDTIVAFALLAAAVAIDYALEVLHWVRKI